MYKEIVFSSSKIYIGNGKVAGYGINFKEGPSILSVISVTEFLSNYQGVIVLRHKNRTEEKMTVAIEYVLDKMNKGIKYSSKDCLVSLFKHMFAKTGKKLSKNLISQYSGNLFCSNIINLAYIHAGINTGIKNVDDAYVWPVDFLKSEKIQTNV